MLKKIVVLLFATSLYSYVMAQWKVGVSAGYDYNQYDYDTQWAYRLKYGGLNGIVAGIAVSYSLNGWFELGSGVSYQEKGFNLEIMSENTDFTSQNNLSSCLERRDYHMTIPLKAKFTFGGEKVKGFVSIGGFVSYWLSSYFKGYALSLGFSYESFEDEKDFVRGVDNRLEAGLMGELGVAYEQTANWSWFIAANYYHTLTDQHKDYQRLRFPAYNRTFCIQVGVVYSLNKK